MLLLLLHSAYAPHPGGVSRTILIPVNDDDAAIAFTLSTT